MRSQRTTAHSAQREVRAGDRLPEFKVCVGRRETYLADLLDSTRLTLLVAGSGSGKPAELLAGNGGLAPWRTIIGVSKIDAAAGPDFAARFQRAFGPTGGVWLVRPDAYIGSAGAATSTAALCTWLNTWFVHFPAQSV